MNWMNIWMDLFGTTEWLGLDIGFWVSMGTVTLLVVLMNVVFWGLRPRAKRTIPDSEIDEKAKL